MFSFFSKPVIVAAKNLTVISVMAGEMLKNSTSPVDHDHSEDSWLLIAAMTGIIVMGVAGISAMCYYEREKLCGASRKHPDALEMKMLEFNFDDEAPNVPYQELADSEDEFKRTLTI